MKLFSNGSLLWLITAKKTAGKFPYAWTDSISFKRVMFWKCSSSLVLWKQWTVSVSHFLVSAGDYLWSNSFCQWLRFLLKISKVPPYFGAHSKVPPPPPPEMKIVRDFRFEVAQVGLAKYSPLPKNSKLADLDLVFKVGSAKYPPPPKFRNCRFGLSVQNWVGKVPPLPRKFKNSRFGHSVQSWVGKVPPPQKKFKTSRFGLSVQSWVGKVPPPPPPPPHQTVLWRRLYPRLGTIFFLHVHMGYQFVHSL